MNGTSSRAEGGGFILTRIDLRVVQDLVRLRRRTREAGHNFGLERRETQRLSASLFELGRQLILPEPGTVATLRLADGPSLEIQFDVREADRLGGLDGLERLVAPLRGLVPRLNVAPSPGGVILSMSVLFQSDAHARLPPRGAARPGPPSGDVAVDQDIVDGASGLDPHEALAQTHEELQACNQVVVALYGELEDQTARLRLAEDRLQLLLDSVHDYAICTLSSHGIVTSWNAGGERLFGYASDEVVGRSFAMFYTLPDCAAGAPAAQLMAGESEGRFESEGLRLRRGGVAFDAHFALTPLRDAAHELQGFSLVVRDITERRRLEDDLRRRADDLVVANRAKEDFLATLSHELRTPLNAMLGWTRLLRMGKLDATGVVRALETIERNAHQQEQLISDILDVSRIVTGRFRLEPRPTDLAPLVESTLATLRLAAETKGVTLHTRLQFAGSVLGDPVRLQQVIWNLVANSIKFTPGGGSVTVSLDRQGTSAVVMVADTGEGIGSDLMTHVFDRFRQGDASVTRPHGGLGLGLSIVRHIVELHGGRVQVESEGRGRGATFSVHLPIRAVRRGPDEAPADPHLLSGLRVLVVDDESDAREVVAQALTECGANTTAVASAREAFQMLGEFKPDVLVSDIRMPGEDGYALIRRIRALGENGGALPAIALTGLAQPEDRRRALTAGYHSFVPKPVELEVLAAVVRRVSGRD